jgi:hypothetical protein
MQPTRAEIVHLRDRADRALRAGRAREALAYYGQLLANVKAPRADYEAWLDGAVGAYLALGRKVEAGFILLGLRRYGEAQRLFPVAERPLEWGLCAAKLGHHAEAARVLSESARPVLAAIELEAAGASAAARLEWERVIGDPRLTGRPYEAALAHFNHGESLLRVGDRTSAARAFAEAQRLLETAADAFETQGDPVRAFECFNVLLRLGKATDSFENVAEGYLNAIRLLATRDEIFAVQYYDDFLTYAVDRREWHAAAMGAREAANHCLRIGRPYDRHYLGLAVEAWTRAARENTDNGGPADLSANALHAAIDAATALGDLELVGRLYAQLGDLPLSEKRRLRYRALAARYAALPPEPRPAAPSFPEYLRRQDPYADIWRHDLVELELGGVPNAVLAHHLAYNPISFGDYQRHVLLALLICNAPEFSLENPKATSELAMTIARGALYPMFSPLERLYDHSSPQVRVAVLQAVGETLFFQRAYGLIRRGLADPVPTVVDEALRVLATMHFVDGTGPVTRIFRESTDERIRLAALQGLARIENSPNAVLVLLEALRQETGAVRQAAEKLLPHVRAMDAPALIRQARDAEIGDRREALDRVLKTMQ